MRVAWVLVIGCVVAATSVRPLRFEHLDPHAAQIEAAPASLVLVARREAPPLPELRLAPFVVEPAPIAAVPPPVTALHGWFVPAVADAGVVDTVRARGPPMA